MPRDHPSTALPPHRGRDLAAPGGGGALAAVASLIGDATDGDGLLGAAATHHLASGGGAWRARLALDCAAVLGVPRSAAVRLAAACELVHQASVVHDDVQDGAATRRDRPSAAARFGAPAAICLGDRFLLAAFAVLAELPRTRALVRCFAARAGEAAAGQAEEFSPTLWRDIGPDRYAALAGAKAGALVALPVQGAALLAGLPRAETERAGRAARLLGTAYQASDDVEDLAEDLARGALNGVVALDLASGSANERRALLALLDRARREGLPAPEAASQARRLRRTVPSFAGWALGLSAEAAAAEHALRPALAGTAAWLADRLAPARGGRHAA